MLKNFMAGAAALLALGSTVGAEAAPPLCATDNSHACWKYFAPGPSQFSTAFDATEGLFCAELGSSSISGDNLITCVTPVGTSGVSSNLNLNRLLPITGGVDRIALYNSKTASGTFIHVLGNDNVLRIFRGNVANWWNEAGFQSGPIGTVPAVDVDTNTSIDLVDIVAVYAGWLGGSRHQVLGLSSTGVAYVLAVGGWRKHPRLNNLGVTFKAVSSQKPNGNSFWMTSTGALYSAFDMNSSPGPTLNQVLPAFTAFKIRDLGFPYILTNAGGTSTCNPLISYCPVTCTVATNQCNSDADRVYRLLTGSWSRYPSQNVAAYEPGMPGTVPATSNGSPTDPDGPKTNAITDGFSFRGVSGEYMVHHYSNRIFIWIP